MTPTEHLHKLHWEYHHKNYPGVPGYAIPKATYKLNTTNGMTKGIVDFIRFSGGYAERVNRMGFKTKTKQGKEIWVSGGGTNGTADISAIWNGRALRIEVKCAATHDRIRPDQIRYAEKVERAGAIYFVAKTFDEFYEWFTNNF